MTREEKLALYNKAKEAYYNGQEIMTDYEFDSLEKELGLENKSKIGSKYNSSYTVKHPYVMGSLSKVQIHKDKDGNVDWKKYESEISKYVADEDAYDCIITPKYDGCSFECVVSNNKIVSISTRGDGEYGKDLMSHLKSFIPETYVKGLPGTFTLRGEVLVRKKIFAAKYADKFTNPRSFVSSVFNRDYSEDEEFQSMLHDLSIVIYDYRTYENKHWVDHDWTVLPRTSTLPQFYKEDYPLIYGIKDLYEEFSKYRQTCAYALDGIVIKPVARLRINNVTDHRPKDCVAIKFIPMLEPTEVTNITWNLGKTHELIPLIWVKPVEMDGRMVQKCSGHNLGYLRSKGITIGAKIVMSLAGDIIPFMYKVVEENKSGEIPMPTDYEWYEDGVHLMGALSDEEKCKMKFLASAVTLKIPSIGSSTANDIFGYVASSSDDMTNEFFGEDKKETPTNILLVSQQDIYFGAGGGKTGDNALKGFKKAIDNISLVDIIKSCNFKLCGGKVAEQVAEFLVGGKPDWSHLATEGYSWAFDDNSQQMTEIKKLISHFGKTFEDFKKQHAEASETKSAQIPIIMTGEPNDYKSKAEFLQLHPEYRNTTSWKEVKIVFTNSMDSNTGKMRKAREKNIEIKVY